MSEEVMAEAWLLFKCSYKLLKNKVFYFLLPMSVSARGERVAAECEADAFSGRAIWTWWSQWFSRESYVSVVLEFKVGSGH